MAESEEELTASWWWKRRVKKLDNIKKTKIMASGLITQWQIDGETMKTLTRLFSWAPKSLQMVTAAMKLKDACSLEEKLWQTYYIKNRNITLLRKVRLVKAMVFPVVTYGCESWTIKKLSAEKLRLLNCGVGEDSWVPNFKILTGV